MQTPDPNAKQSIFDILLQFLKWRWVILKFTLGGTVLAVAIALLWPKEYLSFCSFRGPSGGGSQLGSLMRSSGALASLGPLADFAMPQGGGQTDYLLAILNSHTVLDGMIDKFDLRHRYGLKTIEDVREALKSRTEIRRDALAELVAVGVYDEDSVVATDMSNSYVGFANKLFTAMNSQAARNNREEIERRYDQVMKELKDVEDSLRSFQETHGVYEITTQTDAAIQSAAALQAQITQKEIELGVKERTLGSESPEVSTLILELSQLRKRLEGMVRPQGRPKAGQLFIPFDEVPSVGLTYLRLFRQVQIHSELIKALVPMLEQAKLQEKRESPSLVVMDKALVPEKKSRPLRFLIVLIGMFGSFALVCLYVLLVEHLERVQVRNPQRYGQLKMLYQTLAQDVTFWKRRKRQK